MQKINVLSLSRYVLQPYLYMRVLGYIGQKYEIFETLQILWKTPQEIDTYQEEFVLTNTLSMQNNNITPKPIIIL